MDFKFSKNSRLLNAKDFEYLRDQASFASSGLFLFFYKASQENSEKTRIGISISGKICNAVQRNLLKRKIREYFRQSDFRSIGKEVVIVLNKKKFRDIKSAGLSVNRDLESGFKKIANS